MAAGTAFTDVNSGHQYLNQDFSADLQKELKSLKEELNVPVNLVLTVDTDDKNPKPHACNREMQYRDHILVNPAFLHADLNTQKAFLRNELTSLHKEGNHQYDVIETPDGMQLKNAKYCLNPAPPSETTGVFNTPTAIMQGKITAAGLYDVPVYVDQNNKNTEPTFTHRVIDGKESIIMNNAAFEDIAMNAAGASRDPNGQICSNATDVAKRSSSDPIVSQVKNAISKQEATIAGFTAEMTKIKTEGLAKEALQGMALPSIKLDTSHDGTTVSLKAVAGTAQSQGQSR